jgi:hypothetical protein
VILRLLADTRVRGQVFQPSCADQSAAIQGWSWSAPGRLDLRATSSAAGKPSFPDLRRHLQKLLISTKKLFKFVLSKFKKMAFDLLKKNRGCLLEKPGL